MQQYGIENFTFELLETVPKDKLSEREKFYIDFYKTKETGLNERSGLKLTFVSNFCFIITNLLLMNRRENNGIFLFNH